MEETFQWQTSHLHCKATYKLRNILELQYERTPDEVLKVGLCSSESIISGICRRRCTAALRWVTDTS